MIRDDTIMIFQKTWQPLVIRVEKGNPLPRRGLDPSIAGFPLAAVLLSDQLHARIGILSDHLGTVVGGTIVDQDQLEILKRLGQYRLDRSSHPLAGLINRDYY